MKLDIVIPCYNASATLTRAVRSALCQRELHQLWLVDDASHDRTWHIIQQLAQQDTRIRPLRLPVNSGVAMARNWGALNSQADIVAFLDADDEYQEGALSASHWSMQNFPQIALIRLRLQAVNLAPRYAQHPKLAEVWRVLEMTVGGNMVFRRSVFLAAGGFPTDDLFKRFGGEDGALGIAFTRSAVVATLFDPQEPAVLHHCREGMHAERLLDTHLFNRTRGDITAQHHEQAQRITQTICDRLQSLKAPINVEQCGIMPLIVNPE